MKKQTKIIAAVIIVIIVAVGGYYGYQKYNQHNTQILKYKGVKLNDTDKTIVDEVLKSNDLEYAYITHNGSTVMLTVKFKKGIQSKDRYLKINKYMAQLKAYYKDKNINVKTMP
ncbi:hypothetical protein ACJDU8_01770 [Clostridium sp. WILCCON 0269]|uniref:Uncharacterized protein n=1 Tax=Candidatus Clostridium eludens TaxID=3381663 RepID=A0ABW8SEL2_9CLOT